jgi:hypothetical protein
LHTGSNPVRFNTFKRGGDFLSTKKARKESVKRPVYVNGVYCKSLTDGAKEATRVLKREVEVWEVQRVVNNALVIEGAEIKEALNEKEVCKEADCLLKVHKYGEPLLRYPLGEKPSERGIRHWV